MNGQRVGSGLPYMDHLYLSRKGDWVRLLVRIRADGHPQIRFTPGFICNSTSDATSLLSRIHSCV
jgi:hypothetical protein